MFKGLRKSAISHNKYIILRMNLKKAYYEKKLRKYSLNLLKKINKQIEVTF